MKKSYQVVDAGERDKIAEVLTKNGQALLPFVDLIETAGMRVDKLIDEVGRATIQAVLELSARGVAGQPHQGKVGGEVVRNGTQAGSVPLSQRRLRVRKPRLRRKGKGVGGEVAVPAYEAMNSDRRLGERMLAIMLDGVSTRRYERVIPEMAETVGVSKSAVSRQVVEASEEKLKELCERRFEDVDLIAIWIDGLVFGEHHVIAAVGLDPGGGKRVLGVREGATENSTVVKGLLADLVERGVDPAGRRLFVIDGSKALRKAIDEVFGAENPVQRCRGHKIRNVTGHLPQDYRCQVTFQMKAAYKLEEKEGVARLKKLAERLRDEYPSAAESLLEGLSETFTVNRLGLSGPLRRCLSTTNIIENPNSALRRGTRRVSRWRDGAMVLRWAATGFLDVESRFRKVMGYRDLWMLEAALNEDQVDSRKAVA